MAERVRRVAAAVSAALLAVACVPAKPPPPPPKPIPEPAQAPPSAEALGPVRIVDQSCEEPPANGDILEGDVWEEGVNYYEIKNQTNAKGIVKVRDAGGSLVVAVYVAPGQTASIGPLADGSYRTSFAMGDDFASDCSHLDFPSGYGQSERWDTFATTMDAAGEPKTQTKPYAFEDSDIDGGDGPQALTADKYNAP